MELTTKQLQEVEKYLIAKNVDYIDLKIELLDHLTTDIEHLISKGFSFNNALELTQQKWNKYFRKSSSLFFGLQYLTSKIILNKAVKEFKPFYFLYLASYSVPILAFNFVAFSLSNQSIKVIDFLLKASEVIALVYMCFIIFKMMIKNKVKTTYSFILKTQYLGGIILLLLPLLPDTYFDKLGQVQAPWTSFTCRYFNNIYLLSLL